MKGRDDPMAQNRNALTPEALTMVDVIARTGSFAGITEYKDTFAFAAMILILLLRPSGIVGEDLSEKV